VARDEGDLLRAADQVIDLDRAARPGSPPVPGAQWDELHGRWERWDEAAQGWRIVGATGDIVRPPSEGPVSAFLAAEVARSGQPEAVVDTPDEDEDDGRVHVIDVDRLAAPPQPVPGAQWNEVRGRWERWDDVLEEWVEARSASSPR
jgi:hypothetical protein